VTWELRAVDNDGGTPTVLRVDPADATSEMGVNLLSIEESHGGRELLRLEVPTLHANAAEVDLFEREVQLWWDGELYSWYSPARRDDDPDVREVECDGLFELFFDAVIGGIRPNHVTPPHEDAAAIGAAPASWTVTGGVDAAAMVDNNAEFWQYPKALQLNNGDAGGDDYAYVRIPVTPELVGFPMAAAGVLYVADNQGGAPAYGGAAYENRGLMIMRLDSTTFEPLASPKIAEFTDDMPRNKPERLQTPEVTPQSTSEVIEVRLYAPAAWTVWRYVFLGDGRALVVDRVDKSVAVEALVAHFQDTTIGKTDRNFGADVVNLGETVSVSWPWWRRDNIGEKLVELADTFELRMVYDTSGGAGAHTRTLQVRPEIGTDLTAGPDPVTLTEENFTDWLAAVDKKAHGSRIIMQGEGSGPAVDEVWIDDPAALGGHLVERVEYASPGTPMQGLWDQASALHDEMSAVTDLPTATIAGDLAISARAGDRVGVNLTYGPVVYTGDARIMHKRLDPTAMTAVIELRAVS